MTNKVQKIREKVEMVVNRRLNLLNGDYFDLNKETDGFTNEIIGIIAHLQEEHVSDELEETAQEYVTKEGYLAGLHYNSMIRSFKAGAEWYASHNTKLPYNLLLAARKASIDMCNIDDKYLDEYPYNPIAEQKFIEGAKWQRNSIWHDAGEEPKENVEILIVFDGEWAYVRFYHKHDKRFYCNGKPKFFLHEIDKWAYISDIIPTKD